MRVCTISIFFTVVGFVLPLSGQVDPTVDRTNNGGIFMGNPFRDRLEEVENGKPADEPFFPEWLIPRIFGDYFDTELPEVFLRGQWSLRMDPKLGDFIDDPYVRFPVGVRYFFSNYFEAGISTGTYFANPFRSGGSGGGLYSVGGHGKYTWLGVRDSRFNVAAGMMADLPLSSGPLEITDGFARYEPFLTISRQLESDERFLAYLGLNYELVDESPFSTEPVDPRPRDRTFVRPGLIFYPGGKFRFNFELAYRTNALHFRSREDQMPPLSPHSREANRILASREVHELLAYPGITWFPGSDLRRELFIPGNWDVGMRLEIPLVEETGENWGVSFRFRWYYDFRRVVRQDLPDWLNGRR